MRHVILGLMIACLAAGMIILFTFTPDRQRVQIAGNQNAPSDSSRVVNGVLDIREVTSESGLRAWLVEDHSVPVISIHFAFKNAGAATDPVDKQGRTRLVSNTMDEGAGPLNARAFQKALRDDAIRLSFQADRDSFSGNLETLSANQDKAFELLKLALTKPRFDAGPLERMKNSNIARIQRSMEKPRWRALRLAYSKVFEGHPYARNSGGTLSGLQNVTPQDLKNYHQSHIARDNLVIGISGDITSTQAAKAIEKIFSGLPPHSKPGDIPDTHIQNKGAFFHHPMDIPQTYFQLWHPGKSRDFERYPELSLLNNIFGQSGFGSRLMEKAREQEGLTYGIYSHFRHFLHASALVITTSTQSSNTEQMHDIIIREMARITNEGITRQELETTKKFISGSLPLEFTSNPDISSTLMSLQLSGLEMDFLDTYLKGIESARLEDINALASEFFDYSQITGITLGPRKADHIPAENIIETLPHVE